MESDNRISTVMGNSAQAWRRRVFALIVVAVLTGIFLALSATELPAFLREPEILRETLLSLGPWGPVIIVGLMTMAIVFSPLPSAPIALAAGALYGHTFGTFYVLIGAELGALIAFAIGRVAGREILKRWIDSARFVKLEGSQGTLMTIVFVTRLMPFISFDAVSYAAGLTPLSPWRFALATFVGILPASFLLGHFGSELMAADTQWINLILLMLGAGMITTLPLLIAVIYYRFPHAGLSLTNEIALLAVTVLLLLTGFSWQIKSTTVLGGSMLLLYLVILLSALGWEHRQQEWIVGIFLVGIGALTFGGGIALSVYREKLLDLPDRIANREGVFRIMSWR